MSVISIKRLLGAEAAASAGPSRVAQLLVHGMGLHAIEGDPGAFRLFRDALDRAADSLEPSTTETAALAIAGTALRLLEEHNRRTATYLLSGGADLRSMIKMLISAVCDSYAAGGESLERLRQIEGRIATNGPSDDVHAIKSQLAICLQDIKSEADRQKVANSNSADRLQEDLHRAQTESLDPATGLRPRSKAVEWIGKTCSKGDAAFACCLVIERLQAVNLTFGSEVGDQMLRYFAGYVQKNLATGDQLFRWTGACLLAVVPRAKQLGPVRIEFERLMERKLEYAAQTPTRRVLLPITARWSVFPFTTAPAALIEQIDAFASLT